MTRTQKALALLHQGTVIPAIPLALTSERKFSSEGQRLLVRYYAESGAGGIAAAVHTTQFEIREPKYGLYEPVLRTVSEEIDRYEQAAGRVVARVAGVCGPLPQALAETGLAKKHGFDAVLLSPSGLSHLSEEDMLLRTKAVAEEMPVIGFYLQPAAGGRIFSFDYWQRLCEIENVVAIKCAPFNRYQTVDVVRAVALSKRADAITLYTGNDDSIVLDLLTTYRFTVDGKTYCKRFEGGLLGHWCVWTHAVVQQFHALREAAANEVIPAELLTLAQQVTDANAALFDAANGFAGCIPGVHEVLRRQGLMEGNWCLDPSQVLSPGQAEEIDRICQMYPHVTDDQFVSDHIDQWKEAIVRASK